MLQNDRLPLNFVLIIVATVGMVQGGGSYQSVKSENVTIGCGNIVMLKVETVRTNNLLNCSAFIWIAS